MLTDVIQLTNMTNFEQEQMLRAERARLAEKFSQNERKGKPRGLTDTVYQDDYPDDEDEK